MFGIPVYAAHSLGGFTATAGTRIQAVVPPAPPQRIGLRTSKNTFARLSSLIYTSGSTAHTLTVMRPIGKTTLSADAAISQAVINLAADPGVALVGPTGVITKNGDNALAANDLLVIECPDGTYHLAKVSSVATLAITLTANVPTGGLKSGATVWDFGITTDKDPYTGLAHPFFVPTVSAKTVYTDNFAGVVAALNPGDPMIIDSDNGTAAGWLEAFTVIYTDR